MRYNIDVVCGGTYGDEGKGKCVNFLCEKKHYDYVFRVNASTNASHCVNVSEGSPEYVTKQLPSVFNSPSIGLVVSNATFLNIHEFRKEIEGRPDIKDIKNNVYVAGSVPLILDNYLKMSKKDNDRQNTGTTNQGTGIAMRERVSKNSIYLYDVYNETEITEELLKKFITHYKKMGVSISEVDIINEVNQIIDDITVIKSLIGDFMVDYPSFIKKKMVDKTILIEGCNGILLDNITGVRPYTTSCSTNPAALASYASLSPFYIRKAYVVVGSYFVCLNKRPFKTEISDPKILAHIKKNNAEIDHAEMMERRIGWFDLPALKRALVGCESADGKTDIFLTKADILSGLEEIKVCTAYMLNGKKLDMLPDNTEDIAKCKPIYETFSGWSSPMSAEFAKFCEYIGNSLGSDYRISYVSTGKETMNTMNVSNLFHF
ncbi:MAG: adenylosuccinate synthetase [Wendovervirus sonii]|uniref:Adenylosuccinate synthetase n=1 Tax=phage Lak_Megaphage_Sonny TaxID=3109229 RepID=A0ABZ0Z5Z2_9CAUD|nr:MAG: adenylosuccinate synthetase [phage Lak_Megaphage_Sonny]